MKPIIKRRLTNGSTTKTSRTKSYFGDGLAKVRPSTKRALLRGSHGSTAFWRANRRWRRALACYVNVPDERAELNDQCEPITPEQATTECDFYTFDNAPKVDRFGLPFNLAVVWASQLPGGLERLVCILLAIFLCLSILSAEIYVSTLSKHRIRSRLSFLCEKPSSLSEVITFECRINLLVLAWIVSMLIAWIVLACHFVFWCCTFRRPTCLEAHLEEGANGEDTAGADKQLDSIVTEESTDEEDQLPQLQHRKKDD